MSERDDHRPIIALSALVHPNCAANVLNAFLREWGMCLALGKPAFAKISERS